MKKKLLIFLSLTMITTMLFAQMSITKPPLKKGTNFTIRVEDGNHSKPRLLKGILKTIGITAASYKIQQIATGALHTKNETPHSTSVFMLPSVGIGLVASRDDLFPSVKKHLIIGYDLYDMNDKLINHYEIPLKGRSLTINNTMPQNGYVVPFIKLPTKSTINADLVSFTLTTKNKGLQSKGGIVASMRLRSTGECIPEAVVCNDRVEVVEYDDEMYHYVETCIHSYVYDYDAKDCVEETYPECTVEQTELPDYPTVETIASYEGCNICSVDVTHHTNGMPDEYSSPYGCMPYDCGEDGGTDDEPCDNPTFPSSNAVLQETGFSGPPISGDTLGKTVVESVDIDIDVCKQNGQWVAIMTGLTGKYSLQVQSGGFLDVTGPTGNTTELNYCIQVYDLKVNGSVTRPILWYMQNATRAHELVHLAHFLPSLQSQTATIESQVEALSVPYAGQSKSAAIAQIKALPQFQTIKNYAYLLWGVACNAATDGDHAGPAEAAARTVLDPMISTICTYAHEHNWVSCDACQ